MRTIEEKIINAIQEGKEGKLSSRDRTSKGNNGITYYLHNTPLFMQCWTTAKEAIFLSSIGGGDNPISATTKSRLNAFLVACNMPKIQQKNFELFCNGEKLEVNSWYLLDCVNKKLVKIASFAELCK